VDAGEHRGEPKANGDHVEEKGEKDDNDDQYKYGAFHGNRFSLVERFIGRVKGRYPHKTDAS
jgi:hypothetical protein